LSNFVPPFLFLSSSSPIRIILDDEKARAKNEGVILDSKKQSIILLTGSEPFDGRTINTSWKAAWQLNGLVIDDALVQSEELPVLWHGSAEMLIELIQTYEPVLVINTGEGGPVLSLEKYAHNRTDSTLDNAGELPDSSSIISNWCLD
jgi:pyroglutamyl-peptidase